MKRTTNIFIVHTPLQNYFVTQIAENFFGGNQYENILISSVQSKEVDMFDRIQIIEKKNGIKKIIGTLKSKFLIDRYSKKKEVKIFISHTSGLLDNYIFNRIKESRPSIEINFFYDGILYFYCYRERFRKSHKTRKIIGRLIGIDYKYDPVIFPHDSEKISKIYTMLPKYTLGLPEKHVKVELRGLEYRPKPLSSLILGGKPALLTNAEVQKIYSHILDKISLNKKHKLFFKGHHADVSRNFEKANVAGQGFEDVTQDSPIEEVITRYSPARVYSYPSSALINLKSMYGDSIELFCFYIKEKKQEIDYLMPILEDLDISVELI
ncbi:alpha-2,8-polysialyltransferase family protein [Flagellimonas oceanensis]|uniref:alpha-2,8-polysialyltransferase family protein n=1 Tax=Flagellimonas oceanensis TaxID=2499163 RepID=UPI001F48BE54|nr:alpha-2,8-polysialyltransferase family protein [Allomuricauda oceanensis]